MNDASNNQPSADDAFNSAPGGVEIAPNVYLPESELRFSFSRSSGPGGQNVNKVSTKARLEVTFIALKIAIGEIFFHRLLDALGPAHIVEQSHVVIVADASRSQVANRQACMDKLRQWVLEAKKPRKNRRATKPTRGSKLRRLDAKKQRGQRKSQRKPPDL